MLQWLGCQSVAVSLTARQYITMPGQGFAQAVMGRKGAFSGCRYHIHLEHLRDSGRLEKSRCQRLHPDYLHHSADANKDSSHIRDLQHSAWRIRG